MRAAGKFILCLLAGFMVYGALFAAMVLVISNENAEILPIIVAPLIFFVAAWVAGAFVGVLFKRKTYHPAIWLSVSFFAAAFFLTVLIHYTPNIHPVEQLIYFFEAVAGPLLGARYWFNHMMPNRSMQPTVDPGG